MSSDRAEFIDDVSSPYEYARRLASYISNPETIRLRTMQFWGRAPGIEKCAELRADALKGRDAFRLACEARSQELRRHRLNDDHTFICGHDRSHENTAFRGDKEVCRECMEIKIDNTRRRLAALKIAQATKQPKPARIPMKGLVSDHIDLSLSPSQRVILLACARIGITPEQLVDSNRKRLFVRARWAVMAALRKFNPGLWSTPKIGELLGNMDHSTVVYALKQAADLEKRDPAFAELIAELVEIARRSLPKVAPEVVQSFMRDAA